MAAKLLVNWTIFHKSLRVGVCGFTSDPLQICHFVRRDTDFMQLGAREKEKGSLYPLQLYGSCVVCRCKQIQPLHRWGVGGQPCMVVCPAF